MTTIQYCTPEWLEESAKGYHSNPRYENEFKKLSIKLHFRVKSEPAWGIDEDIIFGAIIDKGALEELVFFSEEDAKKGAEFIVVATPQEWKKILRKESKFVTDFMLGKITLEQGSKVGILGVASHSNTLIDVLTPVALQFPDEMTPDELSKYRSYMQEFRAELGV